MVRRFEDIVERVERNNPDADLDLLRRAHVFSAHEHRDQKRRSGEPYLIHCLEVAYLLAELNLDIASIASGLLHDVVEDTLTTIEHVEDTLTTIEHVEEMFGADVAHIVAGVTKISKIKFASEHTVWRRDLPEHRLQLRDPGLRRLLHVRHEWLFDGSLRGSGSYGLRP